MPTATRRAGMLLGFALLAALASSASPSAHAAPAEDVSPIGEAGPVFGVNFVPPEEPLMSMAWDAGARIARIQINWQDVERTPGDYGWDYVDSLVDPLVERGFVVHAVLTLPPRFRREHGDGLMPENINLAWDHPNNRWAHWVGAVARHYRGRVQIYEVWNEPDMDQYWNGTPGQYFQLLRSAYPAIKANDPNATVVMAGMAIFSDRSFLPEVIRNVATYPDSPNNNFFFDVLSIHMYTDADLIYDELVQIRDLLDRHGLEGKPIWLTETGVPIWTGEGQSPDPTTIGFGDEEEAGWFVLQGFSSAFAAGVDCIMVYRLHDDRKEPILYGMLRRDYSERPAYNAYRVAVRYLGGKNEEVTREMAGGARIVRFYKSNGGLVTVVWARDSTTTRAVIPAHRQSSTLVDWTGNTSLVEATNGVYNLPLTPSSNPRIGGPALIILESDVAPPVIYAPSSPAPAPASAPRESIPPVVQVSQLPDYIPAGTQLALSWSGDDGEFGTGVTGYDVQTSHNDGPWLAWLSNTSRTSAIYDVSAGGNFKFRVRARDGAGNVSEFVLANPLGTRTPGVPVGVQGLGLNVTSLPPVEGEGDPFFGVSFVPPEEPWIDLAWEAGVRTARTQINWQDVERSPGTREWFYPDSQVLPLVDYGYEVTAILTLPPEFRRADPAGLMPADLYLLWDDPDNAWAKWVFDVATRYKGKIDAYEIWNEPDLSQYWNGSAADYGELLRSAYQAIKAADPNATVVMGGMALRGDTTFLPGVVDYIYKDEQGPLNDYFFDAAAVHVYSDTNLIYDELIGTRELLDRYGMTDKPIWLTETNVPLWGEASGPTSWESGYANPEEAGWFTLQAFATALAADAERVMVYRLHDVGEPIAHGLLRNDQSERPSYTAYQTAATFMSDVVAASREQTPEATIVRLEKANGGQVSVLWANTGAEATVAVDASAPAGLFANADGAVWHANPRDDDTYVIRLDPATNRDTSRSGAYFFGGPPILLIEDDRTPPTVTMDPLPAVSKDTTLTVSWSADDGPLGTGVATYDVQVSVDGGSWTTWLKETPLAEAEFDTTQGGAFSFRVRARDRAGNVSDYVENPTGQMFVHGVLVAQVLNVRGEAVPNAKVTLSDGRTYTTGSDGFVRITDLQEGEITIERVDGGAQGMLRPRPVTTTLGKETTVIWTLLPKDNYVANGNFDAGLADWHYAPTLENDVSVVNSGGDLVLQLAGQRRPWGSPTISASVKVPRKLDAPVLSFRYQIPTDGQALVLTTISQGGRGEPSVLTRLWQSEGTTSTWERVWFDATPYLGKQVEIIFSLEGPKGAPPAIVQIDDVAFGSLPSQ